jgi:hypothetical protein
MPETNVVKACPTCGAIEVNGVCYSHECPTNYSIETAKTDPSPPPEKQDAK